MANEHSQIVPDMQPTAKVADFKFWCQKVLPLVYDDSLSYYEVLNKMVVYLNQVIDNINADIDNVEELEDDFLLLQEYVNNFFDDIDQLVTYAERAEAAETAALSSAASAAESATNAASSAVNAATSSGSAATSALSAMDAKDAAVAAKTAAETALASAQTAATNAANSATAASNSATAASGSATNAAASAASALQNFQLSDAARVAAQEAAEDAQDVLDSIPEDYTQLSNDVTILNNYAFSDEIIPNMWSQGYWTIANGAVNISSGTWIKTGFIYDDIKRVYINSSLLLYLQAWDKSSGNYIGTWNGNAFTTTYISGSGLTDINLDDFRENFPNYNFKITVTASDSSPITPETAGLLIHCIKSVITYNELQEEQRSKYYQQNLIEFYQTYKFDKTTIDNWQYIALDHNKITIEKNNAQAVSWTDVFFMLPYFQPYAGTNATLLSNYLDYFQPVYFNKITILGVNDKSNKTYACGLDIFTIQNGVLTSRSVTFNHTSGQKHTVPLTAEEEAAEKITISFLIRSNEAETNNAEFIIGFENT